MVYKKKRLWHWLLFPFRLYRQYTHRRRFPCLDDYVTAHEATLNATLDIIERGLDPDILPQLSPVYLDPMEPDISDFLVPEFSRAYHDDLHSFVETQQQTRRTGAWTGFADLMTIQPKLSLRISRRIHDYAARFTLISHHADAQAMPIGMPSIYVLMILNNMLYLHHLIETAPVKPSIIRSFFTKHENIHTTMKSEINLGLQKIQDLSSYRESGDMVFHHSIMPFLVNLRQHDHLVPHLNGLIHSSPLTTVIDLTDSSLWTLSGDTELSGIERLMDGACPFYFTGLITQQWVDALITLRDEEQRRVFSRIEHILDYLCSGASVPTAPTVRHVRSGRRCLIQFARMLIRSWSDEWRQEEILGQSPDQSIIWYDILTRIRQRIDDIGSSGDQAWDAHDDRMLRHSIILAQRSMRRAAS